LKPRPPGGGIFIAFSSVIIFQLKVTLRCQKYEIENEYANKLQKQTFVRAHAPSLRELI
jgi:hypothetical protein